MPQVVYKLASQNSQAWIWCALHPQDNPTSKLTSGKTKASKHVVKYAPGQNSAQPRSMTAKNKWLIAIAIKKSCLCHESRLSHLNFSFCFEQVGSRWPKHTLQLNLKCLKMMQNDSSAYGNSSDACISVRPNAVWQGDIILFISKSASYATEVCLKTWVERSSMQKVALEGVYVNLFSNLLTTESLIRKSCNLGRSGKLLWNLLLNLSTSISGILPLLEAFYLEPQAADARIYIAWFFVVSRPKHLTGLLNSPKTKMINGIMMVVFPCPFVQVSLRRYHLEMTDWIIVPGALVPNPPNADSCTPVAFWGLGFGKVKALLRKPMHQYLLVGDPLNSVG